MNERLNLNNVVLSLLTAGAIFMGGWVLNINTEVALLKQQVQAESTARQVELQEFRIQFKESREQDAKMSETIRSLDKTLSLLSDRLDRQYRRLNSDNEKLSR